MRKLKTLNIKLPKLFLMVLLVVGASVNSYGQKMYVIVGGGFASQAGKTTFINADPNNLTNISPSLDVSISSTGLATVKDLSGTLGGGLKINVAGGYNISDYLAIELGVTYLKGKEVSIGKFSDPTRTENSTAYINGVLLKPSLVINPKFSGINPYVRAGLVLTAAGTLYVDTNVDITDGGGPGVDVAVVAETVVAPSFSVGFAGAIGANYPINDKLSLFTEVEFKNFTIKPDKATIERFSTVALTPGGPVDIAGMQLADMPTSQKEFIFSDNFQQSVITEPASNQPRNIPVQFVNAGSLGINIGVKIGL